MRPESGMALARGLSDTLWGIIQECWAFPPHLRPTMTYVTTQLEQLPAFVDTTDERPLDYYHLGGALARGLQHDRQDTEAAIGEEGSSKQQLARGVQDSHPFALLVLEVEVL